MATVGTAVKDTPEFAKTFEALTDNKPYPWQEELFHRFLKGSLPADINLPTGGGKTSIIPIWLIALCHQASAGAIALPRRLVWVVNRRVVVDQATDDAVNLRRRLNESVPRPESEWVRAQLKSLGISEGEVLAISTLRGEYEDNREWSRDPARPAIIIGTVDIIGSRLLFSGYGDSRYWRAQHAGLLGQDALIVNDEAHLTPAFASLLSKIEALQKGSLKPFRTIRLSATHPTSDCWPKSLEKDRADERFRTVFEARKRLFIQNVASAKVDQAIIELAFATGTGRTVVFVTAPEKAQKIAAAARKKLGAEAAKRVLTLTGTMRGLERDQLVNKDEFKAFTERQRPSEDYWLIATSAGEVGINISADRLITGCDTLDHLIQRFGRLNRFGETESVAYLIAGDKEKDRPAAALEVLTTRLSGNETDGYDISPQALFGFPLDKEACSPEPIEAALHPSHIDVWSQTSLGGHPARPQVDPWLHGKEEGDERETYVAWRKYTDELATSELITDDDLDELLDEYPLLAHEQLREPTAQFIKKLQELFAGEGRFKTIIRRKVDGVVDTITLPIIKTKFGPIDIRDDRNERATIRELAYAQLIFSPGCGRPVDGMFQPDWLESEEPKDAEIIALTPYDVSGAVLRETSSEEEAKPELRASFRAEQQGDGGYLLHRYGAPPDREYKPEIVNSLERKELDKFAATNELRFVFQLRIGTSEQGGNTESALLFFRPARKRKSVSDQPVFVEDHNKKVSALAGKLAASLSLSTEVVNALIQSGANHDLGKGRDIWQRAAGNFDRTTRQRQYSAPIAKPIGAMLGKQLAGFRHELASALDTSPDIEGDTGLLLHLIAAHHGHARPCFLTKAYDREHLLQSADEALRTVQRFAELQRKCGPWGLAYLETILRAADGIASAGGPEQTPHA